MNKWIEFTGEYEKEFYDVKLDDGQVFFRCWPNFNTFHTLNGALIHFTRVKFIRMCED